MLAVAGAGKTYWICHELDVTKRNLIIAYTHQNIKNIKNELRSAHGKIPQNTTVMTFHSFVYQCFLCPYEKVILEHFSIKQFERNGLTMDNPPAQRIKRKNKWISNPLYKPDHTFEHYVKFNSYYCDHITKLIIKANTRQNKLINRAVKSIGMFFDCIYVDEFQDFREYDFALLEKIIKKCKGFVAVGDYYQHSVNAKNNTGKPLKIGIRDVTYAEYLDFLKSLKLDVDTETLKKTRRCPQTICEFVNEKLNIIISAENKHHGTVKFICEDKDIINVLSDPHIMKLVYSEASKYNFVCLNWGYSKGDTYPAVCVILTESFSSIGSKDFSCTHGKIGRSTINKLYVAMTRTKGDLYLIAKTDFDRVKLPYLKFP